MRVEHERASREEARQVGDMSEEGGGAKGVSVVCVCVCVCVCARARILPVACRSAAGLLQLM